MEKIDESGKRETLSDIVADLRAKARKFIGYHGVGWCEGGRLMSLADRIEAAWKRERAEIEAQALSIGGIVESSRHTQKPQGNAASLLEALIQCELFLGNVERHGHPTLNPGDKCIACDGVEELRNKVNAALSAPARNCDMFGTDNTEAELAYEEYCEKSEIEESITGAFEWLFAPAWKREKAAIEADALAVGGIVEAARHKPGNATAMREALLIVKRLFDGRIMFQPAIRKAHEAVDAALAAPTRQCDVGTAKEQVERWQSFCDQFDDDCTGCPCDDAACASYTECFARWAQTPYKAKEKGDGDGE